MNAKKLPDRATIAAVRDAANLLDMVERDPQQERVYRAAREWLRRHDTKPHTDFQEKRP